MCSSLKTAIIETVSVPTMRDSFCFDNTPVASGNGYIYVPSESVDDYKNATNWNEYAAQIKPINVADTLPVIGSVAENDLYRIGDVYWKAELVDEVLTWVEL